MTYDSASYGTLVHKITKIGLLRKMDKILINNLRVQGILGVNDWERDKPREILINVILFTDTKTASYSDKVSDSVDYSYVVKEIRSLAEEAHRFTVEALAEDIANLCLSKPSVQSVAVRVEKPGAIIGVDSVGVEIKRGI
jgi:FolB domain-containing protein